MSPATIIRRAQADGVSLILSSAGNIKAIGDGSAVDRWLPVIREHKAKIIDVLATGSSDEAATSHYWLLHYTDREPLEVTCSPSATHAGILERHPNAVAAEPFVHSIRQPSSTMPANEEATIRAWLVLIEESDPAVIADVLRSCEQDADVRSYFVRRANIGGSYTNQSTA